MSVSMLPGLSRGQSRSSHLHEVSPEHPESPLGNLPKENEEEQHYDGDHHVRRVCSLGVHDENFSKDEAILNLSMFPPGSVAIGDLVRIAALGQDAPKQMSRHIRDGDNVGPGQETTGTFSASLDPKKYYVFVVKEMSVEVSSKHPNLQVSNLGK